MKDSVLGAVADNQGAHNKRAEYFFGSGAEVDALLRDVATVYYRWATAEAS